MKGSTSINHNIALSCLIQKTKQLQTENRPMSDL